MSDDHSLTLKFLSLNCWGVHYNAKKLKERFRAIATEIKRKGYDLVALQEVWYKGDYRYLQTQLETMLPYHHYFYNNVVGSGLCMFSKYPIVHVRSRSYIVHTGVFECFNFKYPGRGEMFAGKGISCCKIKTPLGCVSVYNTHTECEQMHRACQLFEAFQFVSDTCGEDPVIFAGDFNMLEVETPYPILTQVMGFDDAFLGDTNPTVNALTNPFRRRTSIPKRIDYIFHSNNSCDSHGLKLLTKELAFTGKIPGENFHFSDHEGIEATFSLSNKATDFKQHRSVRKSFLGEDLDQDARSTYRRFLHDMQDLIRRKQNKVGLPSLVRSPAVAYSIWAVLLVVMLSTILVNLGQYPLVTFLTTIGGFAICVTFAGMLFDMKRKHTLCNVLQEIDYLINNLD